MAKKNSLIGENDITIETTVVDHHSNLVLPQNSLIRIFNLIIPSQLPPKKHFPMPSQTVPKFWKVEQFLRFFGQWARKLTVELMVGEIGMKVNLKRVRIDGDKKQVK